MKYYLFKDLICGGSAIFNNRHDVEIFRDKFIDFMKLNDNEFSECDYEIEELELNPDFDKWIA